MTSPFRLLFAFAAAGFVTVSLAASARAQPQAQQRVVLLHDGPRAIELADGLKVELAARGAEVVVAPSPTGATPLLRAGAAQSAARQLGAAFAVWVEHPGAETGDLLRVVDPETDHLRDAPLPAPAESLDARTFAAVAASLIGELLDPVIAPAAASGPVRVHVQVETPSGDVEVEAVAGGAEETAGALADPVDASTPAVVVVPTGAAAVDAPTPEEAAARASAEDSTGEEAAMPRSGALLSASLMTAFVATGAEVGFGFYLGRYLRLDVFGQGVVQYVDRPAPAGTLGLDLTRVGASHSGRFDIGGFAALLIAGGTSPARPAGGGVITSVAQVAPYFGVVTGAHIGFMWELSDSFAIGFRVAGGLSFVYDTDAFGTTPFGMLSLRTEIAP